MCMFYISLFRLGIGYVAKHLELSDASYSSSSVDSGWLDTNMALMGWIPTIRDPNPWIEVDMLNTYTIVALYLKSYANSYYLTLYDLKVSVDGISYEYIEQNIPTDFPNLGHDTTYWYANATNGRYWRIEPVSFFNFGFVKGDFIGYI